MGKGLSLWEEETVERLGCVLVVPVVLRVFRNGWEEVILQEGMRSLGYGESLHRNVSSFFWWQAGKKKKKLGFVR